MTQHDPISLKVHHKNPKNGRTERVTPYRLHIEGRVRYFEMPVGSGKFFFENGEPVAEKDCPKLTPVQIPLSADELRIKHAQDMANQAAENEQLKAKLAAYEAEKAEALKAKQAIHKPIQQEQKPAAIEASAEEKSETPKVINPRK
jgi:hypothetical protein